MNINWANTPSIAQIKIHQNLENQMNWIEEDYINGLISKSEYEQSINTILDRQGELAASS